MNLRRFSGMLCVVTVLPLLAATVLSDTSFSDVPGTAWYAPYVEQAVEAGIVSGYTDSHGKTTGKFGPQNSLTVGEALKISLEGAGYDTSRGVGFGHWAAKYLSVGIGLGFQLSQVQGLNLDRPATRAEVSSLIVDAFKLDHTSFTSNQYADVTASTPYAGSVQALSKTAIVVGDKDATGNSTGTFRPNAAINRAEMVKIIIGARAAYGTPGRNSLFPPSSSTSFSSTHSSSRSSGSCSLQDCGPAPGMPNWQCPDDSIGGPSCERLTDGRCGWLIRQCPSTSSRSSQSSSIRSSSSQRTVQTYTINYTDTGFQPSFLSIRVGDIVRFRNQSTLGMWIASNTHPTHTDYPEFDQHTSVGNSGEYLFTFQKTGVWGFHNHLKSSTQGVINVEPQ